MAHFINIIVTFLIGRTALYKLNKCAYKLFVFVKKIGGPKRGRKHFFPKKRKKDEIDSEAKFSTSVNFGVFV